MKIKSEFRIINLLFLIFVIVFACAESSLCQTDSDDYESDVKILQDSVRRLSFAKSYDKALIQINKAIEIEPYNGELYLSRAWIYHQLKSDRLFVENVKTALIFQPNGTNWAETCARLLFNGGQYEESIAIADSLISGNDSWASKIGHRIRYSSRYQLQDYAGALEDIIAGESAITAMYQKPDEYPGMTMVTDPDEGMLAKILNELHDDPRIITYYQQLFDSNSEGTTFSSLLNLSRALSVKKFLYVNCLKLYEEKRMPSAAAETLNFIASRYGLEYRAKIYQELKKYDSAIKDLSVYLKIAVDKTSIFMRRGDLYVLTGRYKKALEDFETAKLLNQKSGEFDFKDLETKIDIKISEAKQKQSETKILGGRVDR